jgi:hypothetical protein
MPSVSLQTWQSVRKTSLNEIEEAHRSIGGSGPGRRYATQQINQAYAVMLAGQFQGFCRDLHSESVWHLSVAIRPVSMQGVILDEFVLDRKLDRGNPTPGNIGADFNRLGLAFWKEVAGSDRHASTRRNKLEHLCRWRNAIAHQDFVALGQSSLGLKEVRDWRDACDQLATRFDRILYLHLRSVTGNSPW